ncbi:15495_t:CDS:2, partial [Acaulospora colombiana]
WTWRVRKGRKCALGSNSWSLEQGAISIPASEEKRGECPALMDFKIIGGDQVEVIPISAGDCYLLNAAQTKAQTTYYLRALSRDGKDVERQRSDNDTICKGTKQRNAGSVRRANPLPPESPELHPVNPAGRQPVNYNGGPSHDSVDHHHPISAPLFCAPTHSIPSGFYLLFTHRRDVSGANGSVEVRQVTAWTRYIRTRIEISVLRYSDRFVSIHINLHPCQARFYQANSHWPTKVEADLANLPSTNMHVVGHKIAL